MTKFIRIWLFIVFFTISSFLINNAYSGVGGPPGDPGGGDPPCFPNPCIPIDGGIIFLITAGILYGGKKAFGILKNNKKE